MHWAGANATKTSMPTAKELHDEVTGPAWRLTATLAAVKKASSLLAAMAHAGMDVGKDTLVALLKERAAAEVM